MLKKLTPAEIRRLQLNIDQFIDDESADTIRQVRRFLTSYVNDFKGILSDVALQRSEVITLKEQTELVSQLIQIAKDNGFEEVIADYEKSFARIADKSLEYFSAFGVAKSFAGVDTETIDLLASSFVEDLGLAVNRRLIKPLETQIRASFIALKDRREFVRDITRIIDNDGILRKDGKVFTDQNIEVLVADSNVRFARAVRTEKARALGLQIYQYLGPLDGRTRPACQAMLTTSKHGVPGMYYENEITTKLHPDLTANPLVSGGGFNCRHAFYPVTDDYAAAQGFQLERSEEAA